MKNLKNKFRLIYSAAFLIVMFIAGNLLAKGSLFDGSVIFGSMFIATLAVGMIMLITGHLEDAFPSKREYIPTIEIKKGFYFHPEGELVEISKDVKWNSELKSHPIEVRVYALAEENRNAYSHKAYAWFGELSYSPGKNFSVKDLVDLGKSPEEKLRKLIASKEIESSIRLEDIRIIFTYITKNKQS